MTKRPTVLEATALYVALTLAMTWPLVTDLGGSLPGDLGDPLLNGYILSWGEKHLVAFLGGDLGAFGRWWQANIFCPAPYALAYSEHLFTEVVMALPVWLATHNVILAYNVVFLGSIALSGLGMFLLVRELTGDASAGFLAGLGYAFLPYRFAQIPHVQVMSSEWMPLTIYAFRRYVAGRRPAALAGAFGALVAQQLACGYYLIYFTPFVVFYVLWEIRARNLWRDIPLVAALTAAFAADALCVWPFLSPYLELRRLGFPPRTIDELAIYSADVWGYFTASPQNRLWGNWLGLSMVHKPENELFPGLVTMIAGVYGVGAYARRRWLESDVPLAASSNARRGLFLFTGVAGIALAALWMMVFAGGATLGPFRVHNIRRALTVLAAGTAGILVLSPRARSFWRFSSDLRAWAVVIVVLSWAFSLGPIVFSRGRLIDFNGPYRYLYEYVPGFDGLRVPARLAMVVALGLSVLAGYGFASIGRIRRRLLSTVSVGLLILVESAIVPMDLNLTYSPPGLMTPGRVWPEANAPSIYRRLAELPRGTVIAEFPFGVQAWELQYVFYASVHEQPLLNGFSGGFPDSYAETASRLSNPLERPDESWQTLVGNRVTIVVVHRRAYLPGGVEPVIEWLRSHGAEHLATVREAEVFRIPRPLG